jgi:hypothetical protein
MTDEFLKIFEETTSYRLHRIIRINNSDLFSIFFFYDDAMLYFSPSPLTVEGIIHDFFFFIPQLFPVKSKNVKVATEQVSPGVGGTDMKGNAKKRASS